MPDDKKSKVPVKAETTAVAVSNTELTAGFGGPEASVSKAMPMEVAWPEIKLSKSTEFVLADGSKVTDVTGHIIYVQRSRAFFAKAFDGTGGAPDCACSNINVGVPDAGDSIQAETCEACPKCKWEKVTEDGNERNRMACGPSMNMVFLPEGKAIPRTIRIRSTSIGKKSSLAAFFTNCLEEGYALSGKYQTVKVKLTLEEKSINNFQTSILFVSKVDTMEASDEKLPMLIGMYNKVVKDFVVVHAQEGSENGAPATAEAQNAAEQTSDDDIPI